MNDQIKDALNWRYAVKKFDPTQKINETNWNTLVESLRLAPSSYGLQPWKFLVVQDKEKRKQLRPISWNQSQVEDASHFIVFTTLKKVTEEYVQKYINQIAHTRSVDLATLDAYKKGMIADLVKGPRSQVINWWAQKQSYIAMGFVMETAAFLGVDTCALEGIDPVGYDKVLGLEGSNWATVAAVALGYRHSEDKLQHAKKVRFETKDIIEYV